MALVKVLAANLFAGANFQKLEVGQTYDVDDAIAEKWIVSGKAEKSSDKKGEKLSFEVASPSSSPAKVNAEILSQIDELNARIEALTNAAETAEASHAEAIAELTKRAETAEAALAATTTKGK